MIHIGGRPKLKGVPRVLAIGGSLALAVPVAPLFGGSLDGYLLAAACTLTLLLGGITAFNAHYYRPIAFDPRTGTARLGSTDVPVRSVTRALRQRNVSGGSRYLTYRFETTDGVWGRVLVAGRPMPGLDDEGIRRLAQFIEATAIAEPDDESGLTPAQRYLADALRENGGTSPAGKAILLAELRGEPLPEPELEHLGDADVEQWQRDDADADTFADAQPARARRLRRVFGMLTAAAVAVGFVLIIAAAVGEELAGGELASDTNAVVGAAVAVCAAVGLTAYVGYGIATYVHTRHAQRVALQWLRARDEGQVARGLPPRLLEPFLSPPPAHRLITLAAFAAGVVGMIGVIGGPVAWAMEDAPDVGAAILVVGIVFGAVSIVLFLSAARARHRQQKLAVRLGGTRLVAEFG